MLSRVGCTEAGGRLKEELSLEVGYLVWWNTYSRHEAIKRGREIVRSKLPGAGVWRQVQESGVNS
jgi:hypothetical protein